MLTARQVTCVRDDRVLFADLSFQVKEGELVQIEGPNGSGKTSLLRILTGLLSQDEGEILWHGEPIRTVRDEYHHSLLFLGHQTGVKRDLSVLENLRFYAQISPSSKTDDASILDAILRVGLAGYEDVLASHLSAGQQRRIALARLWLSEHALWILDEPLTAIDKRGISVLETLFLDHAQRGGSIILTSHQDLFQGNSTLRRIVLGATQ
ncbi:cytochrome c biogenesis heme-transporting ATPase CcmA [Thaumasiovibrio subtropicus]|uniref:cytochrome c biogenesis heme-transporting ATPase CcmA n=1 Tax=Thaumasiovibrio subtropicus TaxID=1891207 RepID=UPI000B34F01D|nr:cytochrome c biogenesis heme-transporting ATPase CcmA [Thaumasiovibrio subtropicus]